eukprot:7391637-Prymnesium_polylepis.2
MRQCRPRRPRVVGDLGERRGQPCSADTQGATGLECSDCTNHPRSNRPKSTVSPLRGSPV